MREVDKYINSGIHTNVFTSANLRIVSDGKVVLESSHGIQDPTYPERETKSDSVYDLASVTKVYVATAFMRLVENKFARLDQEVSDVIPSFSDGTKKDITFRHLLSHSSGLPASFNLYSNGEWNKGKDIVIRKLVSTELIYQPGGSVVYSCLGFMLLGYAMENIYGKGLNQTLDELVFKPMKLSDIQYKPGSEYADRLVVTTDERPNRGVLKPGVVHDGNAIAMNGGISGNAGLFGTAESVSRLGEAFQNEIFLKPETIREMTKLQAEHDDKRYGLGWQLHSTNNLNSARGFSGTSYGHTGFTGTSLWVDPEKKVVVTFLTNSVRFYKHKEDAQEFNNYRYGLHERILAEI